MNEKGQTMTPNGNWWYDEWSPKFEDQPVDIKYNWEIYYTFSIFKNGKKS